MNNNLKIKIACYTTSISMSAVICLSPLLFLTFRESYGISFTLLGLLVAVNFITQLLVDLLFSFLSHKFNIPLCVKLTPVLTFIGLLIYSLIPLLIPEFAVVGIFVGTIIFSIGGGLSEVLMSPVIAALPADNPEHEMSKLHSVYAWGVVGIIAFSSIFLMLVGYNNWHYLALTLSIVPLISTCFFMISTIPQMETPEKISGVLKLMKNKELWLCFVAIFLGGAAENTMSQWCSGYIEASLGIPKIFGDIFGLALFALFLGIGRTLYSKIGKNISYVLLFGAVGATICYLVAALSPIPILGLIACALTGFFTSMLWPGSLIIGQERIPQGGVFMFAMMAAGGDFGSAVVPQIVGSITDIVTASEMGINLAQTLNITAEQVGMKSGMLIGMIFPLIAIFVYLIIIKTNKNKELLK